MRILVIGATGTIGAHVIGRLGPHHDIIATSRQATRHSVDITDPASIAALFESVSSVDAVICTAGAAVFAPLSELTPDDNETAVRSKLLGQINLVLIGQHHLRPGGSFTLTSGIMTEEPIARASSAAMANGGIEAFVKTAAAELPQGQRINVVSPTLLDDSREAYGVLFPGFESVAGQRVASAYEKSVMGVQSGQVYQVR